MNAERARGNSKHHQNMAFSASSPSSAPSWRRSLSTATAIAAFFSLSWIVACSDNSSANPTNGTGGASDIDGGTDCTKRTELDTYSANMLKTGSMSVYKFQLISSDPAPPGQSKLVWMLKIVNVVDGTTVMTQLPIVGLTEMPDHGHPIPNQPKFAFDTATGIYTVTNIDFGLMPGRWRVRFSIRDMVGSDVMVDSAGFDFCIQ